MKNTNLKQNRVTLEETKRQHIEYWKNEIALLKSKHPTKKTEFSFGVETGNGESTDTETTQASHRGGNGYETKWKDAQQKAQAYDKLGDEVGYELGNIFTGDFSPQSMLNITQSVLNSGLITSFDGLLGASLAGGIGAAVVGFAKQAKQDKIKRNVSSLETHLEKHKEEYTVFQNAVDENDNEALFDSHKRLTTIESTLLENTDYLIYKADQSDLRKLKSSIEASQQKRNEGVLQVEEEIGRQEQLFIAKREHDFLSSSWKLLQKDKQPISTMSYSDLMKLGAKTRGIDRGEVVNLIRSASVTITDKTTNQTFSYASALGLASKPYRQAYYDPYGNNGFFYQSDQYAYVQHTTNSVMGFYSPDSLGYDSNRAIFRELSSEKTLFGANSRILPIIKIKIELEEYYKVERLVTNKENSIPEVHAYFYSLRGLVRHSEVYDNTSGKMTKKIDYLYTKVDGHLFWNLTIEETQKTKTTTRYTYRLNVDLNSEKRKEYILTRLNDLMVAVPGGSFKQGGKLPFLTKRGKTLPTHIQTVSDFRMSKYELTTDIWMAVMNDFWQGEGDIFSSYAPPDPTEATLAASMVGGIFTTEAVAAQNSTKPRMPVVTSFEAVGVFIKRLNQIIGRNFRLPAESEWEYAASSGGKKHKYFYSGGNKLQNIAWYGKNASGTVHPVGLKKANIFGLHDMSGNVWEWYSNRRQ